MNTRTRFLNGVVASLAVVAGLSSIPASAKILLQDNFDNGDPYKPDVVCDMPNDSGATPTADAYWMRTSFVSQLPTVTEDATAGTMTIVGIDGFASGLSLNAVSTYGQPGYSSVLVNSADPCLNFFATATDPNPKRVFKISGLTIDGPSVDKSFHNFKLLISSVGHQGIFNAAGFEINVSESGRFTVRTYQPALLSLKTAARDNFLLVPPYYPLPNVPHDITLTLDPTHYTITFDYSLGLIPGLSATTVKDKINTTQDVTFHTLSDGSFTFTGEHGLDAGVWAATNSGTPGAAIFFGTKSTSPLIDSSATESRVTTMTLKSITVTDGNP